MTLTNEVVPAHEVFVLTLTRDEARTLFYNLTPENEGDEADQKTVQSIEDALNHALFG